MGGLDVRSSMGMEGQIKQRGVLLLLLLLLLLVVVVIEHCSRIPLFVIVLLIL